MRLNDLAKKLNITNRELLEFLQANGADVTGHMSNVSKDYVEVAKAYFSDLKAQK